MKETVFINLTSYESNNKHDLMTICYKYGLNEDRIYWSNFRFTVDVFHSETK